MKKEEFVKLGIDEETAKKCEAASQEELKGFIPKTRFDEVNNEKKKLELDLRDRDGQLETLKNSTGDVEAMKQQIATLQAENQNLKLKASQAEQNTYLVNALRPCPIPSYSVPNPFCCYGYQQTNTCGCC